MKFIVALVIVGALLFAFCAGFYMVVLGSVQVSDYHSYDVDPFVTTTCFIINVTIVEATRKMTSAFFLDLNVNFTAYNLTQEGALNYAAFDYEKDATSMADRISSEGQVECFYRLWEGEVRVYVRLPSNLQTGIALATAGCIALVGCIAAGSIVLIMIRRRRLQEREAAVITELIFKATQGVSTAVDCAKKGADVQMQP